MERVNARVLPKDMKRLQKSRRVEVAREMLVNVVEDPTFIKRIITGAETWVYNYDVESVQQPSEWQK